MIINVRGTSGSGKSTLARRVMGLYPQKNACRRPPRKQPIAYLLSGGPSGRQLAVIGHYETECGGTDTISDMDAIFEAVRGFEGSNTDVLYEGLLLSADARRVLELHAEGRRVEVVSLEPVPLEDCFAGINDRRRRRMGPKFTPVARKNTESKYKGVVSSGRRLEGAGVPVHRCDREQAFLVCRRLLGFV